METSPWLNPAFLLVAGTTLVGLIGWFIRGEFQSKANTVRQREYEESMNERVDKMEATQERIKSAFYEHKGDGRVHHNEEAFKEFREGLNQRLTNFDTKFAELKSLIISNHKQR